MARFRWEATVDLMNLFRRILVPLALVAVAGCFAASYAIAHRGSDQPRATTRTAVPGSPPRAVERVSAPVINAPAAVPALPDLRQQTPAPAAPAAAPRRVPRAVRKKTTAPPATTSPQVTPAPVQPTPVPAPTPAPTPKPAPKAKEFKSIG
jgi:hypothetical protein